MGRLVVARKYGEKVTITIRGVHRQLDTTIEVEVLDNHRHGGIRLAVSAPEYVSILRNELLDDSHT